MSISAPFDRRVARLRAAMQQAGADLFLVDSAELMTWISGFGISETLYRGCLVPAEGEPWIVLRALDAPLARANSWIETVLSYPDSDDPLEAVAVSIETRGFADGVLGYDPNSYGHTTHRHRCLSERLPGLRWVGEPGISDRLRAVKDDAEVTLLRRAATIADRSMAEVRAAARTGLTVREAAAVAASAYLRHGADDGQVGRIAKGRGGSGFLHAELNDHPLEPGDILHCELVPRVQHYSARMMRPVVIDAPARELAEAAEALLAIQDAQYAAMQPGALACDVDAVLRDAVLSQGLRDSYENVTGYTLGIYHRTPRSSDFSHVFLPTSRWRLEPGMVFHMYASARGLGFSDTILVTEEGPERLTRTERALLRGTG